MLSFFPTPRPDELLYSILARYHIRSTNISPKATLIEIFGSATVTATFDLPSNLKSLILNLPVMSAHTTENLMKLHTLYPFYAPFLSPERAVVVSDSMQNHFRGDIHTRIGVMASAVPTHPYFRFCPVCLREEIEKYGEPYWHRIHQISGVMVCPVHCVRLRDSIIKTVGNNKHEFLAADEENCPYKPTAIKYSTEIFDKLITMAQDIETLLDLSLKPKTGEWYRNQYQKLLVSKGLATESGRVRQKEFIREFEKFYGTNFLKVVHSAIETDSESNWLAEIVRKHRKTFHPVRHLLLIRFLGETVDSFFLRDKVPKPFGDSPWVCFNGGSKHYLKRTIRSIKISYSREAKRLIGTFSCRCGFAYSTSDPSIPYGSKLRFGKIKSFGKVWEEKLTELLVREKNSFRKIARYLKVDTKTVINHAKCLNLISVNEKIDSNEIKLPTNDFDHRRNSDRKAWKKLKEDNPCFGKTELRKIRPRLYIWLYRHDRKWLDDNSPKKTSIRYVNKRVDWLERDNEIFLLTKKAIKVISEKDPPVRITVGAIGKVIGFRALLEKHIGRLPETAAFLAAQSETVEMFQIRRISWAVTKLVSTDKTVALWKVVRLVGLKKKTAERFRTYIEGLIREATFEKSYGRIYG